MLCYYISTTPKCQALFSTFFSFLCLSCNYPVRFIGWSYSPFSFPPHIMATAFDTGHYIYVCRTLSQLNLVPPLNVCKVCTPPLPSHAGFCLEAKGTQLQRFACKATEIMHYASAKRLHYSLTSGRSLSNFILLLAPAMAPLRGDLSAQQTEGFKTLPQADSKIEQ